MNQSLASLISPPQQGGKRGMSLLWDVPALGFSSGLSWASPLGVSAHFPVPLVYAPEQKFGLTGSLCHPAGSAQQGLGSFCLKLPQTPEFEPAARVGAPLDGREKSTGGK